MDSVLKAKIHVIVMLFMLLFPQTAVSAENGWLLVAEEHSWVSSNLSPIADRLPIIDSASKPMDLSAKAYLRHFDEQGKAPSWDFLQPLMREAASIASLKGLTVRFHRTGSERELEVAGIPDNSSPAKPFLVSTADKTHILAVLPYYFALCKDNRYLVWVFTDTGEFRFLWRSLPTHYLKGQPQLLVAAEKAGCCESLTFSFRFYDLSNGSVREYSCPEGLCGDVVFEELGAGGPLLIGLEVLAGIRGSGASLLTNLFVVDRNGGQLASCSLLTASRRWTGSMHEFREASPFSLSALRHVHADRQSSRGWIVEFAAGEASKTYQFVGKPMGRSPTVVFVQWDGVAAEENTYMHLNTSRGQVPLPLLLLAEGGTASVVLENAAGDRRTVHIPIGTASVEFISLH